MATNEIPQEYYIFFIIIGLFELVLKGIALWQAAKRGEKGWYISILVFNTVGLLPLIYILFFSKKDVNKS
ncbi:MAG: DUF5652 family protein [Candidatus Pacebacteria bacterium]|nr:DUF5652 family protein [Candidatus Paceibacterota bacterium]